VCVYTAYDVYSPVVTVPTTVVETTIVKETVVEKPAEKVYGPQPMSVAPVQTAATEQPAQGAASATGDASATPELTIGASVEIPATGLGAKQGMAVIEVNGIGLRTQVTKWQDDKVGLTVPPIGLTAKTPAKLHILNDQTQLLASVDVTLVPAEMTAAKK
jgi:hypothetical protein